MVLLRISKSLSIRTWHDLGKLLTHVFPNFCIAHFLLNVYNICASRTHSSNVHEFSSLFVHLVNAEMNELFHIYLRINFSFLFF